MDQSLGSDDRFDKLRALTRSIGIGMLTTVGTDGALYSRPMATAGGIDDDGCIWFFADATSPKVGEFARDPEINVAFAAPDRQSYASLSGTAGLVRDRAELERRWHPDIEAYFPQGIGDPNLALIRVSLRSAEYWDSPASSTAYALGAIKAIARGERYRPGENETLELK